MKHTAKLIRWCTRCISSENCTCFLIQMYVLIDLCTPQKRPNQLSGTNLVLRGCFSTFKEVRHSRQRPGFSEMRPQNWKMNSKSILRMRVRLFMGKISISGLEWETWSWIDIQEMKKMCFQVWNICNVIQKYQLDSGVPKIFVILVREQTKNDFKGWRSILLCSVYAFQATA